MTEERCEGVDSQFLDSDIPGVKSAKRTENQVNHKVGKWPLKYAHFNEQKFVSKQPKIGAQACVWRIGADFKYQYLKL